MSEQKESTSECLCPFMFADSRSSCACVGKDCMAWQWDDDAHKFGHCTLCESRRIQLTGVYPRSDRYEVVRD